MYAWTQVRQDEAEDCGLQGDAKPGGTQVDVVSIDSVMTRKSVCERYNFM